MVDVSKSKIRGLGGDNNSKPSLDTSEIKRQLISNYKGLSEEDKPTLTQLICYMGDLTIAMIKLLEEK